MLSSTILALDGVPTEARIITTLRFCYCCLFSRQLEDGVCRPNDEMKSSPAQVLSQELSRLSKSTPIQTTFHPDHLEVECHERDFPQYEEMTEASGPRKSTLKENH